MEKEIEITLVITETSIKILIDNKNFCLNDPYLLELLSYFPIWKEFRQIAIHTHLVENHPTE